MALKGLGRLNGKVAIVTGAADGIGRGIASVFAYEGAKVMLADINVELGNKAAESLRTDGHAAQFTATDVSRDADVRHLIKATAEAFGRLDILINNAGIGLVKNEVDTSEEEWDKILGTNAKGTFLCTKHAIPLMRKQGGGAIVNIGSLFSLKGSEGLAAYAASKGAIRQLTKSSALAHATENIRVNAVYPGVIATPQREAVIVKMGIDDSSSMGPAKKPGVPEDIAYACVYLVSDEAKFVTGAELSVDGGAAAF